MPLDYLSCFAVVLKGIQGKVDICQTDYCNHSKLRIFPYSEGKYIIQANERLTKVKEKKFELLNLMFLFFLSFSSFQMSQTIVVINKSAIFYTYQTSGACAGVCACNLTHQMEKTDI